MSIHDHTGVNGTLVNGRQRVLKLVPLPETEAPPAPAPERPVEKAAPAAKSARRERRRIRRALRTAVTDERTRSTYRFAVRHGAYLAGGTRIVARRTWDGRTTAVHQKMIASAAAAGDVEAVAEWQDKADRFRQARHARRMALIASVPSMAKATVIGAGVTEGVLLAIGIAMAFSDGGHISDVIAPTEGAIEFVSILAMVVSVVWGPMLMAGPILALLGLWAVGRNQQAAPQWALPADAAQRDVVPDEGAILNALRNLGIAPLNKAFKEGWQPRWVSGTGRLGNGWHTQLQLPLGVTVEMINAKKTVLAHNLLRLPIEVWPTEPRNQPGVLDLWVADQGSLSGVVPPWPLLTEGISDYFKGVPLAISQRGDQIIGQLMAKNWMVGGIMGSGKSSLVIALLLGAMLDPLVDIDAYVMAYNVDYDPLRPRLRTLIKGDEDEQIEAAMHALRDLRDEVTRRGKLLEELGGEEVRLTRAIAQRDPRMRPRVVVFDECHELFMHKAYGKEAEELAIKVMKKARKVGITLIWVTVSPTADSIPRDVTRNTSNRVAFAVGDHVANDGLLGTGKHKAGITATTLNPGEDIGTALTVGFTKAAFELVRCYYVRKDAEVDQITPVVDRAMELWDGPAEPSTPPVEAVDPLTDMKTVVGDEDRVRTPEVIHRLKNLNPRFYANWDGGRLRKVLTDADEDTGVYQGYPVVNRDRVLRALANREQPDPDAG